MRTAEWNDTGSMVPRIAALLGAFGPRDRELGVSELARRTGLAKSTVSRIVGELVEVGFLERSGSAVYLGIRVFELGELATRPQDLKRLALANMADLRHATGQTVHLAVLEGIEVVYIEILRSRTSPRLGSRVGGRMPAYATGVGKALLAYSDENVVDRVIAAGLQPIGPQTITSPDALRRQLDRVRTTGIAYEREESGRGVACAASPIMREGDGAIAALSVTGPVGVLDVESIGLAVQTAALALSRTIAERPRLLAGSR